MLLKEEYETECLTEVKYPTTKDTCDLRFTLGGEVNWVEMKAAPTVQRKWVGEHIQPRTIGDINLSKVTNDFKRLRSIPNGLKWSLVVIYPPSNDGKIRKAVQILENSNQDSIVWSTGRESSAYDLFVYQIR